MAAKRRCLFYLSYVGTNFCGSQYQICRKTGIVYSTVQSAVERALKNVFELEGERPIITRFCSRTDAGVHALKAAACADLPLFKNRFLQPCQLKKKLNYYFLKSYSIRILDVLWVPDSFNFKDACLHKTYLYRVGILKNEIYSDEVQKYNAPITELSRTHFIKCTSFDLAKAEAALYLFEGKKDFAALGRKISSNQCTICNILSFKIISAQPPVLNFWEAQKYKYYHFMCTGTRFLNHMVRCMVGAVISVGLGRITLNEIEKFFKKPKQCSWTSKISVPPGCGLYLVDTTLDPLALQGKQIKAKNSLIQKAEDFATDEQQLVSFEKEEIKGNDSLFQNANEKNSSSADAA